MPITPSALVKRKKPVSFAYGENTVNLEYYPAAINDETVKALNALRDEINAAVESEDEDAADSALHRLGAWFCTVLAWWDYTEDDGETMQAITPENIGHQITTFSDFMQAVTGAIMEDRNQGNANGTPSSANSANTSASRDSSDSSRASRTRSASASSRAG